MIYQSLFSIVGARVSKFSTRTAVQCIHTSQLTLSNLNTVKKQLIFHAPNEKKKALHAWWLWAGAACVVVESAEGRDLRRVLAAAHIVLCCENIVLRSAATAQA